MDGSVDGAAEGTTDGSVEGADEGTADGVLVGRLVTSARIIGGGDGAEDSDGFEERDGSGVGPEEVS